MSKILILFVLCTSSAFASEGNYPTPPPEPPPPPETGMAQAEAVSASTSNANAVSGSNSQSNAITGPVTATAETGPIEVTGGEGGKGGKGGKGGAGGQATAGGGASSAVINNVTPDDIRIRNNGAIALSSPNINAPCWVGYGGAIASGRGTISLFPARRDPACMAMLQFEQLVNLGLIIPAATAYCSEYKSGVMRKKDGFWKPFGSVEQCQAGIIAALEASVVTDSIVVTIDVDADEPQTCVTTGENVRIEMKDTEGVMHVYDCGELRGKASG